MSDKDDNVELIWPDLEVACSESLYRFLKEYIETINLFLYVVDLSHKADQVTKIASRALIKAAPTEDERKKYKTIIDEEGRQVKQLRKFSYLNSRNLTVTTVDNFLCYCSELLQQVMIKRPQILRSNESLRIEEILQFNSYPELISYIVDKKINDISHSGIKEIDYFISSRLGLEMFATENGRRLLAIFVEIRNIHCHNRGVINDLFFKRIGHQSDFNFVKGKRFYADFNEFALLANNCLEVAEALDRAVTRKFGLKRKRYTKWDHGP